jgi:hypothetical protein
MRILLISIGLLLISFSASAQEKKAETLFSGEMKIGGFGGPQAKFTEFNGEFAVQFGGRGGFIINETFSIGGGGYGIASRRHMGSFTNTGFDTRLNIGYGGLILEYIHNSDDLFHFTFNTLIGAGGAELSDSPQTSSRYYNDYGLMDSDWFFVVEPELNLDVNLTRFMRFSIGASYRYIGDVQMEDLVESDLSGFSANIMFKFGRF